MQICASTLPPVPLASLPSITETGYNPPAMVSFARTRTDCRLASTQAHPDSPTHARTHVFPDRHTGTQNAEKQEGWSHADTKTQTQTRKYTGTQAHKHSGTQTHKHSETHREKTEIRRDTQRHTETHGDAQTHRDTQTDTSRYKHADTQTRRRTDTPKDRTGIDAYTNEEANNNSKRPIKHAKNQTNTTSKPMNLFSAYGGLKLAMSLPAKLSFNDAQAGLPPQRSVLRFMMQDKVSCGVTSSAATGLIHPIQSSEAGQGQNSLGCRSSELPSQAEGFQARHFKHGGGGNMSLTLF